MTVTTAPEIKGDWLNCEPFELKDLGQNIVLVVFWSYGCEASKVRLRQAKKLMHDFGDSVQAVGVHTPRFSYEADTAGVVKTIVEQDIDFPILNDHDYRTWDSYSPQGWPSTFVLDPHGGIVGQQGGTPNLAAIELAITENLQKVDASKKSTVVMRTPNIAKKLLLGPTKLASNGGQRLAVVDPAQNQVVILQISEEATEAKLESKVVDIASPSAVTLPDNKSMYLADIVNKSVTRYDLVNGDSQTLTNELLAPTDLILDRDGTLVVADAGLEQIFRIIVTPDAGITMGTIAGSGLTGCQDGIAGKAELAQPVALVRTEVGVLFCDAASSTIRLLTDRGKVTTVASECNFTWGFNDGPVDEALFQRPSDLGLMPDNSIIVADTGNNVLRRISQRRVKTIPVEGLNHPEGLCVLPTGHVVIADTGNSRLVVTDPQIQRAWPLEITEN